MFGINFLKETQKKFQRFLNKRRLQQQYKKTVVFLKRKPFTSFLMILGFLFLVIVIGDIVNRPKTAPSVTNSPKTVSLYYIGTTPRVTFQARIDKPGVIKVLALSPGIIQTINVSEGDTVDQGQQLFVLANNYQGGNAPLVQSEIAAAQYKNILDTFDEQNAVIQHQRDITNFTRDNFTDTQSIATQSASDTSDLVNKNQAVLDQLNAQLATDIANGVPAATLTTEEAQINQLQGAQNQLKSSLTNLQNQTNAADAQTHLADAQRDLTLQQLDLQSKSLVLNREVAALNTQLANINEATMFPVSPFAATVQRIYVRVGQQVAAGTPLAEISTTTPQVSAIVDVPENMIKNISPHDVATVTINKKTYSVLPSYIPTESTNGTLYSLIYPLPKELFDQLADGAYISMTIPVGHQDTSAVDPFVPLDAIYQTEDSSYVMIAKGGIAVAKKVTIGTINGSYAEIMNGLGAGDEVILNRDVIAGDKIQEVHSAK